MESSDTGIKPGHTHLARHRSLSAEDRTCIPLGLRSEETLVVCYSPDEGRTKVWSFDEGAKDPVPGTVRRWRHGPRSWPMCLTRRSSERFPSATDEGRRPLLLRLRGPRPSLRQAKGRCIPLRSIPRPRYCPAKHSIFWSLGPHIHRGNGYRRPKSRSGRGRLDGL